MIVTSPFVFQVDLRIKKVSVQFFCIHGQLCVGAFVMDNCAVRAYCFCDQGVFEFSSECSH